MGALDTIQQLEAASNPTSHINRHVDLFVKMEGTLSHEGNYGHQGEYTREFTTTRILEVRPWKESDCQNKN
jgi:hypothetical protein